MCLLQVTMQDYRSEVKELFAADEQLAAEVEYNLKQFEKEKQQQEQQQMENQLANFTMSPRQNVSQTHRKVAEIWQQSLYCQFLTWSLFLSRFFSLAHSSLG